MVLINVFNIRLFIILFKYIDLKFFLILINFKFIDVMLKDNWFYKKGGDYFYLYWLKF